MKVLFQSRIDIFDPRGGDTFQMEHTKSAIEKLDPSIQIDIKPELKVSNIDKYDIVHLFNLDWVCETYVQAKWAKKHGKKLVLSAIHHSEEEVLRYEKEARYDIRRLYNFAIPWQSTRDLWKNVYRSIFNPGKIYPTFIQAFKGIRNEQRKIVKMADAVLVQTDQEAQDIKRDFKVDNFKWHKVVNGVNVKVFENADKKDFEALLRGKGLQIPSKILLCVGRVEPRKNQLNIIKAFLQVLRQDKDLHLIFIGEMSKKHPEYKFRFKKLVSKSPGVHFLDKQPQEIVASAMAMPGVFINASWFETTGLVALEASLAGMPSIVSGNRVREYLGDNAVYCDPGNIENIKGAILKALDLDRVDKKFREEVKRKYSWEEAARQTVRIYKNV